MEYMQKYSQASELHAAIILSQVLDGLSYAHSHGIMHRDIKPENILFKETHGLRLCIADWGLSHQFEEGQFLQEIVGSAQYVSPQVLVRRYSTLRTDHVLNTNLHPPCT